MGIESFDVTTWVSQGLSPAIPPYKHRWADTGVCPYTIIAL